MMYGVFQKLGQAVERVQRKAANYLNHKTASLTPRQVTIGLVIFCLLFGGSSAFTIWHSLQPASNGISIEPLKTPAYTIIPGNDNINDGAILSRIELDRIKSFRLYLDSLQQTKEGRALYDSIAATRPGLLDSLALIEYQLQLKTSENGKKK